MKRGGPDRPPSDEPLEGCARLGPEETMLHQPWHAKYGQGFNRYEDPPLPV
jgi:hypothetical protein